MYVYICVRCSIIACNARASDKRGSYILLIESIALIIQICEKRYEDNWYYPTN